MHVFMISSLPKHLSNTSKKISKKDAKMYIPGNQKYYLREFLVAHSFCAVWDAKSLQNEGPRKCTRSIPKLRSKIRSQSGIQNWSKMKSKSWGPNFPRGFGIICWTLLYFRGPFWGPFVASFFERFLDNFLNVFDTLFASFFEPFFQGCSEISLFVLTFATC